MPGKIIYKDLSYQIMGVIFEVYNELGYGYQEKYYEKAIAKAFDKKGILYKQQLAYKVKFKGEFIGIQYLDFLIEDRIILELKKGNYFPKRNIEQIKRYLNITNKQLAILANFTSSGVKSLRILNINNKS
jgi:GxxExxY protein